MVKIIENHAVCEYVFQKYLSLKFASLKKVEKRYADVTQDTKHRVYDHLGMIDTLGHDQEIGTLTYHYSCEMGSMFAVKTPTFWMLYINDYGKRVIIGTDLNELVQY